MHLFINVFVECTKKQLVILKYFVINLTNYGQYFIKMIHKGTIGILGGMGPEATNDLYREIINCTSATKDQEHIPVLINSNPKIPDRTDAILYNGENPVTMLAETAKNLEEAGADFIVIPCNTSHYFINDLRALINIPIVSMIDETVSFIKKNYPDIKNIGLLATTGTVKSKIYHDAFAKKGIEVVSLEDPEQEQLVMAAIYGEKGIKSGEKKIAQKKLRKASVILTSKGAQAIIMACTEIPLALKQRTIRHILINPTKILAEKAVLLANSILIDETIQVIDEEEE